MNKAFTLIEIIVSIGIIALLSGIMITYNRSGERQIVIFKEQARVISALSRVKSFSISTFSDGKTDIPCGYGVHLEAPRTFLIFKDIASDCSVSDNKYSGTNEIFESFNLDLTVMFDSLTLSDIIFIPPDPSVIITPAQYQATIVIKTIDGGSSATIKVNNAGQIST